MEGGGENLDVTFTGWMVFRFVNCHVEVARNDDVTTVGHLQTSVVLFHWEMPERGLQRLGKRRISSYLP